MPTFTYHGPGHSLSIAGRTLTRGVPTDLEGRAAQAAADHPDVSAAGRTTKPTAGGLSEYAVLQDRAKELGIPATGKMADLAEAIAAEEALLADG